MAEAIDTAYVEIRPDFSGFGVATERGIRQQLRGIDTNVPLIAGANVAGLKTANSEIAKTEGSLKRLSGQSKTATTSMGLLGGVAARSGLLVGAGIAGGVATAGLALGKIAQASIDFETAFSGVRKTVNATPAELAKLRAGFIDLSTKIPVTASALANIGEAAGQLGVKTSAIPAFTKTVAELGVTTNLTSEQAADAFARIANITQLPQTQFENMGSTVVALGNQLAATESEITDFGLRIAGAGKTVGLSNSQILSIGAALSSVGLEAEAGGTAISTTLIKIASAVAGGGKKLEAFAKVAGVSSDEFATKFRKAPAAALVQFIRGLGDVKKEGGNVFATLEQLGLGGIRVRDALLRSAGAGDLLARSLKIGETAWARNTALQREAGIRFGTTASEIQVLRNEIDAVAIAAGDKLGPAIGDGANALAGLISSLRQNDKVISTIQDAFSNLGKITRPIFDVFRDNADVIKDTFANAGETIRRTTVLVKPLAIAIGVTLVVALRAAFFALDKINTVSRLFGVAIAKSTALAVSALDKFLGGLTLVTGALDRIPGINLSGTTKAINDAREKLRAFSDDLQGIDGKTVSTEVKVKLPTAELNAFLTKLDTAKGGLGASITNVPGTGPAFGITPIPKTPPKTKGGGAGDVGGGVLADVPKAIAATEQRLQDQLALAQALDDSTANDKVALANLAAFYDEQSRNMKLAAGLRRGFLVRAAQSRGEIRALGQQEVQSAQDDAETRARAAVETADATERNQRDDISARRRLIAVLRNRVSIAKQTGDSVASAQEAVAAAQRDLADEFKRQKTERLDLRLTKANAALEIARTTEKTLVDDVAAQRRIVGVYRKKLELARSAKTGVQAAIAALRTEEQNLGNLIRDQAQKRADARLDAIEDEKRLASFTEGKADDEKALRDEERFWKRRIASLKRGSVERRKANVELKRTQKEIRDLRDAGKTDQGGGQTIAGFLSENTSLFKGIASNIGQAGVDPLSGFDFSKSLVASLTRLQQAAGTSTARLDVTATGGAPAKDDAIDRLIAALDRNTDATTGNTTASKNGGGGTNYVEIAGLRGQAAAAFWQSRRARQVTEDSVDA